jgi:hypothetical protein
MNEHFAGIGHFLDEATTRVGWARAGHAPTLLPDGVGIELLEFRLDVVGYPRLRLDVCSVPERGIVTAELWSPEDLKDAMGRGSEMTADDVAIHRRVWSCNPLGGENAPVISRELAEWMQGVQIGS